MSDPFKADLHCHSRCSDGSLTPLELVALAQKEGLQGLSITDHDSVEAYALLEPHLDSLAVRIVSGVEFSAWFQGTSVHLLGYSFSPNHKEIQALCNQHAVRREQRNKAMLEKLAAQGFKLNYEDIVQQSKGATGRATIGRPHIALAMVQAGYVTHVQAAFKQYLGEGRPCYVPGQQISIEETLQTIHNANGFAIPAHPHLIRNDSLFLSMLSLPFDGLECYYSKFAPVHHERWVKTAQERGWLITGGSDFHGSLRPEIPLGCSWTEEGPFKVLEERYKENRVKDGFTKPESSGGLS